MYERLKCIYWSSEYDKTSNVLWYVEVYDTDTTQNGMIKK